MAIRRTLNLLLALTATAVALVSCAVGSAAASSRVFTVNDVNDFPLGTPSGTTCKSTRGLCTLRSAVQAADNLKGNVTIKLPAGTYTLTIPSTAASDPSTGDLDIAIGLTLTVIGRGTSKTIVKVEDGDRAFSIAGGASLSLQQLTITGGSADGSSNEKSTAPGDGGSIFSEGALLLSHAAITDSTAEIGGAVFAGDGSPSTRLVDSTLDSDSASGDGGALEIETGSLGIAGSAIRYDAGSTGAAVQLDTPQKASITGSTIDFDYSYDGGAIFNSGTGRTVAITRTDLSHDSSSAGAGALVDNGAAGTVSITSSRLDSDAGTTQGAAYLEGSDGVAISRDTFANDTAGGAVSEGGAIVADDSHPVTVTDSTFTGDSAESGGALYYVFGKVSLTADTLDANFARQGGAIEIVGGSVGPALVNDTLLDNVASDGGGIGGAFYVGSIVNTIVAYNTGGDCDSVTGTHDVGHNLDSDASCFGVQLTGAPEQAGDLVARNPRLGPLANNGGPTQTAALLNGSPAIGHGSSSLCPKADQRGVAFGASCDIGAFHYRIIPERLTLSVSRRGHTLKISGRLKLPHGTPAADARDARDVPILIVIRSGPRVLANLTAKTSGKGQFTTTKRIDKASAGSLALIASFSGNSKLAPAASKTIRVRLS